jgi:hypothetical protein
MSEEFRAAVTVAEMARMVGLSRSRFYQLIGRAFPEPSRNEEGRPYYDADQQAACLGVKRQNRGIDGKPVIFYTVRKATSASTPKRRSKAKQPASGQHTEVLDAVRSLGLATATAAQVDASIKQLFPTGLDGVDSGEVIKQVFLAIGQA